MAQQVELACLAADHGAFDAAVSVCSTVPESRRDYAACQSLIASVYRQLGRHALAEPFDAAGLAAQQADPLGVAMCSLGLAADAIGLADPDVERALRRAEAAVRQVPPDHWATRWFDPWLTHAWVEAEVGLLRDDPMRAVAVLQPFAFERLHGSPHTRWPHERAKTWLFLGVAQRCAGQSDAALDSLSRAVRISAQAALRPLLVPAVEQLALLDPEQARQWEASAHQARRYLRRHLPSGL
jgi:hypothetical protein